MTRKQEHGVVCGACGAEVQTATLFSLWLRELEYPLNSSIYVAHNLDYIWFNYRKGWLITIEEKTHDGNCTHSQQHVHNAIAAMLSYASGKAEFYNPYTGKKEIAIYKGHYVLRFSLTSPEDSAVVRINEVIYGYDYPEQVKEAVKYLLQYGEPPPRT